MIRMEERKCLLLTYIVVVIVRLDVSLVQITIWFHCVPGPLGVFNDFTVVIPVVFGTGIVYHVVWASSESKRDVTTIRAERLTAGARPTQNLSAGV